MTPTGDRESDQELPFGDSDDTLELREVADAGAADESPVETAEPAASGAASTEPVETSDLSQPDLSEAESSEDEVPEDEVPAPDVAAIDRADQPAGHAPEPAAATLEPAPLGEDASAFSEPAPAPPTRSFEEAAASLGDDDAWQAMGSTFDTFTDGDYLAATTTEYEGLAETVRRSETETHELQAVAATMPGLESGLVGFEDVTGERPAAVDEPKEPSDLPARIGTALALLTLLGLSLWAGGGWFVALATIIAIVSLGEFYAAARRVGYVPVALFGLLGVVAIMVSGWFGKAGGIAGAVAVFVMIILLWYSVLVRRNPLENAAITVFGLVWVGGLLGFAAPLARSDDYVAMLVSLVLVAATMDVGSYFVGRSVGKRQMAPVLSPKKTWEGLAGGIVAAFGMAGLLSLVPAFDPLDFRGALWLALAVSIASPIGDLAESMVKRTFGIKDMGSILPGHGGLLDRIDGLLFAVPVGYFVFRALGYVG